MRSLFVVAFTLLLSGCFVQGTDDLREFVAEAKAKQGAPVEPLPKMPQVEAYAYTAAERGARSPFMYDEVGSEPPVGGVVRPPRPPGPPDPLEEYELDSLRMVGTLAQDGVTYGLVQSKKDGMLFRVRQGNYIGTNDGRISGIFPDRIDLVEIVHGSQGVFVERRASIALGQK